MDSDDDDDMADLFSFGADTAGGAAPSSAPAPSSEGTPTTTATSTTTTTTTTNAPTVVDEDVFHDSDDSFLKMLDEHPVNSMLDGDGTSTNATNAADAMNDQETQDILNWLEEDDTDADALLAAVADESVQKQQHDQKQLQQETATPQEEEAPVVPPTPVAPTFTSLEEALESSESTKLQILEQWEQSEQSALKNPKLRPLLWSRLICNNKSIDDLTTSSLADSFQDFIQNSSSSDNQHNKDQEALLERWIRSESAKLAPRVVRTHPDGMTVNEAEEALQSILLYHYHNNSNNNNNTTNNDSGSDDTHNDNNNTPKTPPSLDPLLPPVVCAILSAGIPKVAAPVLMSYLVPSFMPFVALTPEERSEASKLLHTQFYLLACYHLPMLVYHLDRYMPGWYWPQQPQQDQNDGKEEKENSGDNANNGGSNSSSNDNGSNNQATASYKTGRNNRFKQHGVIPPSWLMTHLVGECGGTSSQKKLLDPNRLLQLLDLVFTNDNNSLRFFLVLAVLEQHSDTWLELTGQELMDSLLENMQDSSAMTMEEWAARAQTMKQATPDSVVDRLRTAEDEAVKSALKERQKKAELALKARLEAEAAAHREAQERKAEEARLRLTRARLVAYYRRFNPTKEANIDKIMETYQDRFEELDLKLKKKYGVGFNPAINPNKKKKTMTETANDSLKAANESMKKTMQSMNDGMKKLSLSTSTRKKSLGENPLDEEEENDGIRLKENRVSVSVKVGETLPSICMTREQANDIRRTCLQKDLPMPLRYYLVDSRSEDTAAQQGRFPTAARLSPETLMDPELLQMYEESFETVRGTCHICVMGEGHSAIPALYNQKLTPELEELMQQDESRTNNCALFFVKRGFPFVSVLEGGFASAHAWLVREGAKKGFDVKSLLVDYDPDVSLFGQMEKIRVDFKAQAAYKTQRALQSLLDQSLYTIVRGKMLLEEEMVEAVVAATSIGANSNDTSAAAAATTTTRPAQVQRQSSKDGTLPGGLSSFFGRRQQQPAAAVAGTSNTNAGQASSSEGENKEPTAAAPAPAPAGANQPNRLTRWRQAAVQVINAVDEAAAENVRPPPSAAAPAASQQAAPQQQQPQQGGGNRFGALGGMLRSNSTDGSSNSGNNPVIKGPAAVLRRNPFARFGGGAPAVPAVANPFARFGSGGAAASSTGGTNTKAPQSQQASPRTGPTIVSLPPRPDETTEATSEDSSETVTFVMEEESDKKTPNVKPV